MSPVDPRPPADGGTEAVLRDGRTVRIRPMRADDEAELLQAFERLGPDARYMRFMRAVRQPNLARLRRVLADLGSNVTGVVATVPAADGFDIVGSAVLVTGQPPGPAEFATSVLGDWAGAGLGRVLLVALIDGARERGLAEIDGFVLASNQPMLKLAARLGFSIARDPEDATVRVCRLSLRPPQETP